jgi:hypothetical protein
VAHLTPGEYDRLERAILDGRRVALVRQGREVVVIPLRLFFRNGREVIEARHPTTGDLITRVIDELDAVEVVP